MPSVKKKNLVRRDAFSGYDGCRVVTPNGHPSFCRSVDCRAVRPNGYFLFIVQLGHAEWPSLLCCSMRDVQRVLSGPAEWPLFTVQCFNVQY